MDPLQALILSRDPDLINTFMWVLDKAGMQVGLTSWPGDAIQWLARRHADAVVVDCERIADALDVIETLRMGRSNRSAITFAIVREFEEVQRAYKSGANFALTRPVTVEAATRAVEAAKALIEREHRRYVRQPVESVGLFRTEAEALEAKLSNVSEGGLAARAHHRPRVPLKGAVRMRFNLPQIEGPLEGSGEIAWSKDDGFFGVRFRELSNDSRMQLNRWLLNRYRGPEPRSSYPF